MIHYILLPAQERHALRREYRLRLAIVCFFFFSLAMVLGITSMLPSYALTYNQENEAVAAQDALTKSRTASGADKVEKDLLLYQSIAEKIIAEDDKVDDVDIIQKILGDQKKGITLGWFQINHVLSTSTQNSKIGTTTAEVVFQGKALTRDSLLQFENALENDPWFGAIELPLSDLAKSKDIDFNFKLRVRKQ